MSLQAASPQPQMCWPHCTLCLQPKFFFCSLTEGSLPSRRPRSPLCGGQSRSVYPHASLSLSLSLQNKNMRASHSAALCSRLLVYPAGATSLARHIQWSATAAHLLSHPNLWFGERLMYGAGMKLQMACGGPQFAGEHVVVCFLSFIADLKLRNGSQRRSAGKGLKAVGGGF